MARLAPIGSFTATRARSDFADPVSSQGWFGYSDEKVARLTREAIGQGFNHFKVKVGGGVEDDRRRLALVRSIIDDPKECAGRSTPAPETLVGKNAGPTGSVLMIDANQVRGRQGRFTRRHSYASEINEKLTSCLFLQVWDVEEAVEYVKQLAEFNPWFIEEPTAPVSLCQIH